MWIAEFLKNVPPAFADGFGTELPQLPEDTEHQALGLVPEELRPLLEYAGEEAHDVHCAILEEAAEAQRSNRSAPNIGQPLANKFALRTERVELIRSTFWLELRQHFANRINLGQELHVWKDWVVTVGPSSPDGEAVIFIKIGIDGRGNIV